MKFKNYLTEAKFIEPLFDVNDAPALAKDIEKKVNAPHVHAQVSTLGGAEHVSILLSVSLDKHEDWTNGIFQNSRFFQMDIERPNTVKLFSKHYTLPKFRKARAKSKEEIIKKINDYIKTVK